MSRTQGSGHGRFVRDLFARISRRYDLLNRLMTFGQDLRWRRQAVQRLPLANAGSLLDVGAGTGDLALEILRRAPHAKVVAVDFAPEMIARGRARKGASAVHWVVADALQLPFSEQSFNGVISGFLMRNLIDIGPALEEQQRVMRRGGTIVSLDAVAAESGRRNLIVEAYFKIIIPLLGRLVAGDPASYNYLPASMDAFLSAKEFRSRVHSAGFVGVDTVQYMFGTIAMIWGSKAHDRLENLSGDV